MAAFARMIGGEWKMTVASGTSSFHTWHWGPGRYSMRVMTDGLDAAGNPWRDLGVIYWHPGRGEVREFGVSQFERGITEGTIRFDGEVGQSDSDLYQTGRGRRLRVLWNFDGPDQYRASLLEASPPGNSDYILLTEWDLFRTEPPEPPRPFAVDGATGPSDRLEPLRPLLGAWEVKVDTAGAGTAQIQSTLEWIPLADAIYARVVEPVNDREPIHLLDAYFYHHTGTGALRCLALSSRGGVYDGELSVLEGGALEIDLEGSEGDQTVHRAMRFDFEHDGTLRQRAWAVEGDARALLLDVRHERRGTRSD